MSLPEGLERLLRAAYEAGAKGETSAKTALEKTLERIEVMDSTQPGAYGQAATDFLTHVRNSLGRCPRCGHAPHGSWCANMASDNDCSCTYDPAAEWVDTIEMGDRLSAIAGLADATEQPAPSLHQIGTPVHFAEGDYYIEAVSRDMMSGTTVSLVDASRYMQDRVMPPPNPNYTGMPAPVMAVPIEVDDRPGIPELGRMEHVHLRTTSGPVCLKDRSGVCGVRRSGVATRSQGDASSRKVEDCEECHGRIDDPDIKKLGYARYGRHLCVKCYLAEGKKGSESWEG